jgi:hypothetical protein
MVMSFCFREIVVDFLVVYVSNSFMEAFLCKFRYAH